MQRIPLAAGNTIIQGKNFIHFSLFIDSILYKSHFLNDTYFQKTKFKHLSIQVYDKSRQNNVMTFFKRKGTSSLHREAIKGTLIYQTSREYKKKSDP